MTRLAKIIDNDKVEKLAVMFIKKNDYIISKKQTDMLAAILHFFLQLNDCIDDKFNIYDISISNLISITYKEKTSHHDYYIEIKILKNKIFIRTIKYNIFKNKFLKTQLIKTIK